MHLGYSTATLASFLVAVTPAASAVADTSAPIRVVELPPLVVSAWAWRYATAGDTEVLSYNSDRTLLSFLEADRREQQRLLLILPKEFQAQFTAPKEFILIDESRAPAASKDLLAQAGENEVKFLSNLRLHDHDAITTFAMLPNSGYDWKDLRLSSAYVRFLLGHRTPALPGWFIFGLMDFFESESNLPGLIRVPFKWRGSAGMKNLDAEVVEREQDYRYHGGPYFHVGESESGQDLLKPSTMFELPPPVEDGTDRRELWESEASLIVRWGLEGGSVQGHDPNREAKFWKFLDRAAAGPVTEAMLRETLGLDYRGFEHELRVYLLLRQLVELRFRETPANNIPAARFATAAEIARIKGDWERLAGLDVAATQPQFAAAYFAQAQKTFDDGLSNEGSNPQLLASLGLFEVDRGEDEKARPHLETAVQANVARPRIYFELARIRYQDLQRATPSGRLDAAQVAPLISLLTAANTKTPALPEVYHLAADILSHTSGPLDAPQRTLLETGLKLFPRDPELARVTAGILSTNLRLPLGP